MRPAVFLDRDGTINEESGYVRRLEDFRVYPFVPAALRRLNRAGVPVIVVTNQSAIARGYVTEEFVRQLHETLAAGLAELGARIDAVYYCPHHPDGTVPELSRSCDCRKPGIGMLLRAAADLDIDLTSSYVVGDKALDLETAENAGATGVLVLTGYGSEHLTEITAVARRPPACVAQNLADAVLWIEADLRKRGASE